MNMTTRLWNGTRDSHPYHARTKMLNGGIIEVDVIIFHRRTGEPFDSFIRTVEDDGRGYRAWVRAVIANPDNF